MTTCPSHLLLLLWPPSNYVRDGPTDLRRQPPLTPAQLDRRHYVPCRDCIRHGSPPTWDFAARRQTAGRRAAETEKDLNGDLYGRDMDLMERLDRKTGLTAGEDEAELRFDGRAAPDRSDATIKATTGAVERTTRSTSWLRCNAIDALQRQQLPTHHPTRFILATSPNLGRLPGGTHFTSSTRRFLIARRYCQAQYMLYTYSPLWLPCFYIVSNCLCLCHFCI